MSLAPGERLASDRPRPRQTMIDFDGLRTPLIDALRYGRLENVLALAGLSAQGVLDTQMTASMLGCDTQTLDIVRAELQTAVEQARDDLLVDSDFARAAPRLPFASGDVIVAVGDSITADALSWADILASAFARLRPQEIELVNASVSGDTTADIVARFQTIAMRQPNWIIAMIGTNDARRHGRGGNIRMVSPSETERNLGALRTLVSQFTSSRLVLLTPSPVDQDRVLKYRPFHSQYVTWRAAEVAQVAEIVRRQPTTVVDIHQALLRSNPGSYLTADGIHPSIAGQRAIARAIVLALSALAARDEAAPTGAV